MNECLGVVHRWPKWRVVAELQDLRQLWQWEAVGLPPLHWFNWVWFQVIMYIVGIPIYNIQCKKVWIYNMYNYSLQVQLCQWEAATTTLIQLTAIPCYNVQWCTVMYSESNLQMQCKKKCVLSIWTTAACKFNFGSERQPAFHRSDSIGLGSKL